MKGQTYVILTIIFSILITVFAILNIESVEVTYFFWKVKSPLILIILFSVLMGGLITTTVGAFKFLNLQKENRQLKERIMKLEEQTAQEDFLENERQEEVKKEKT